MNCLFIDTDLILYTAFNTSNSQIFDDLLKLLDQGRILILPEIIQKEVVYNFEEIKNDFIKKANSNLSTKRILGIEEESVKGESKQKNKNKTYDVVFVDNFIEKDRNNLMFSIEKFYGEIFAKLQKIINHKNTKLVKLTDKLVMAGAKRSL